MKYQVSVKRDSNVILRTVHESEAAASRVAEAARAFYIGHKVTVSERRDAS